MYIDGHKSTEWVIWNENLKIQSIELIWLHTCVMCIL